MFEEHNDTAQSLYNMMKIIDDVSYDYDFAAQYISDHEIESRNYAVTWMKQVNWSIHLLQT